MTLESWKSLFEVGGVILLLLTFVFGVGALVTTRKVNAVQEGQLREFDSQLTEAKHANLVLSQEIEKERDARTEIEERVEWRRLTRAEQSAISATLRTFPNMNGGVWFNAGDYEGNLFARDIGRAILGAGWGMLGPASKMDLMEMGAHFNVEVPSGVIITSTADQPSVDAAHALVKSLSGLGFDCSMSPTPDSRHGLVIVTVEARPQGPQGPAKLRHLAKAH